MSEGLLGQYGEGQGGGAAQDAAPAAWADALPDDLRGMVEAKGWKEPVDALNSYKHLESLFGSDKAGRTLLLPRDEGDAEALDKIYTALGRPEKADGYGFGEMFQGRELHQPLVDAMSKAMHEAGLSKTQAARLATAYDEFYNNSIETQETRHQADQEEFAKSVDPEKLEMARRGFRLFGLPQEELGAVSRSIERALGVERAVELFASLGRKLGEDSRVEGEGVSSPTSAAGAERRISERMSDKLFLERYMRGDKSALAEMEELARMAADKE